MMKGESAQRRLNAALNLARSSGRGLNAAEIARHAHGAGLGLSEALAAVRMHARNYHGRADAELEKGIASFVCSVATGQRTSRVLEFTAGNKLFAAELVAKARSELTVFARDVDFAEALKVLLAETPTIISAGIPTLHADEQFSTIICAPPIGMRTNGGDGFGTEVVSGLASGLADDGVLCWITARGVLFGRRSQSAFSQLSDKGLHVAAVVDLAPGELASNGILGVLIVLRREKQGQRFVGALRAPEDASSIASAFKRGPRKKGGALWAWLPADDDRSFTDLEHERLIRRLTPRGRYELKTIRSLLADETVHRADRPVGDSLSATALLFVPEYSGSRVTADFEEQTVKSRAVYRLVIDATQANPRFLAQVLNSPYGRHLRNAIASGVTIQRVHVDALLSLSLPLPDLATQDRIARAYSDIGILQAVLQDMQDTLELDWTGLADTSESIDSLKSVLDIEHRIADWWRELPYPMAAIYRRYQVSTEPKEKFETLLHFFEMFAVYLATVGTSHVKATRRDWRDRLASWLHPPGAAGIERADFGFWMGLAGASLKDTARITSEPELKEAAIEIGGRELVQTTSVLGGLGKAIEALDVARHFRNKWKGHGGHLKPNVAERLDHELQQQVRNLYEVTSASLRSVQLVRLGKADVTDTGLRYEVDLLSGSDPTFEAKRVELDRRVSTGALAFWGTGARTMCRALPFFRLGLPEQPQETSFYFFNRVEKDGFRWVSYQEVREQDFVASDDELSGLIALSMGTK